MKYLVGDIGNTLSKFSLLDSKFKIIKSYNTQTFKLKNKNNLTKLFKKIFKKDLNKKMLFSSVVPKAFKNMDIFFKKKGFITIEIKNLKIKNLIKINVNNFKQLGSDRIANAIGSYNEYKNNCLVIDFGTATTFDVVKSPGLYEGGVIAPGIQLSIINLNKNTAKLPVLNLKSNSKSYGKNTNDALNAGFLWGYQGLINNIIKKISNSSKTNYKIILTGGYAKLFKKHINKKSIIDENITIKGIIEIYKKLVNDK